MDSLPPIGSNHIRTDSPSDQSSEVQPIAYRVAAGILLTNVILGLVGWLLGSMPNILAMVIDAALMIGLFLAQPGTRGFTLFRAYAGAIVIPVLAFFQNDPLVAAIITIAQLGYSSSLVLLLQGATRKWKIFTAIALFVILNLGTTVVLFGIILLSKILP